MTPADSLCWFVQGTVTAITSGEWEVISILLVTEDSV